MPDTSWTLGAHSCAARHSLFRDRHAGVSRAYRRATTAQQLPVLAFALATVAPNRWRPKSLMRRCSRRHVTLGTIATAALAIARSCAVLIWLGGISYPLIPDPPACRLCRPCLRSKRTVSLPEWRSRLAQRSSVVMALAWAITHIIEKPLLGSNPATWWRVRRDSLDRLRSQTVRALLFRTNGIRRALLRASAFRRSGILWILPSRAGTLRDGVSCRRPCGAGDELTWHVLRGSTSPPTSAFILR